jgi:hypothetical protein
MEPKTLFTEIMQLVVELIHGEDLNRLWGMNVGKEHQKFYKHKYCVILGHGFFPQGL